MADLKFKINKLLEDVEEATQQAYIDGFNAGSAYDKPTQKEFDKTHREPVGYGEDGEIFAWEVSMTDPKPLSIDEVFSDFYSYDSDKEHISVPVARAKAQIKAMLIEAETRGVAWSIKEIDYWHGATGKDSDSSDKFYKGIKNKIRDSYKNEVGIDPAPNYPVNVRLHDTKDKTDNCPDCGSKEHWQCAA